MNEPERRECGVSTAGRAIDGLAVAVDIVEVGTTGEAADRCLLRPAMFTRLEWHLFRDRPLSLAGRLAAKRAAARALGAALDEMATGGVLWTDIEILQRGSGRPVLRFSGRAAERAAAMGLSRWLVSISHTKELAVAFVLGCRDSSRHETGGRVTKDPR